LTGDNSLFGSNPVFLISKQTNGQYSV